jgi:hypothetical protein
MIDFSDETVRELAAAAGLTLPPERLARVAELLRSSAAAARTLDAVDLRGVEPELAFHADWD